MAECNRESFRNFHCHNALRRTLRNSFAASLSASRFISFFNFYSIEWNREEQFTARKNMSRDVGYTDIRFYNYLMTAQKNEMQRNKSFFIWFYMQNNRKKWSVHTKTEILIFLMWF